MECGSLLPLSKGLRDVSQRATQTLKIAVDSNLSLLTIALDHLTLGRAALYAAVLNESEISNSESQIEQAVSGLLTRAWLRSLTSASTGPESAHSDLDEAWEIAARGPMPLFMADIHLYRARLFGRQKDEGRGQKGANAYPWILVEEDLKEARRLIEKHG